MDRWLTKASAEDHLRSREAFLEHMATLDWDTNPYGNESWLTRIIDNHRQIIKTETGQTSDEMIDYVLAGVDPAKGYVGAGCSVFDPMMVLWALRNRGESYRADEIDAVAAQSFITWLENWDAGGAVTVNGDLTYSTEGYAFSG